VSKPLNQYQFRTHPIGSNPAFPDSAPDTWRTDIVEVGPVRSKDYPQGGRRVGFMEWEKPEGNTPSTQIWNVEVDPAHRRRGLATEALRHSQRVAKNSRGLIPMPVHADDRTTEGDVWARSTGDWVPENQWGK
jgi:ribosomal protein S18 acetylase RimI-like enzyme